MLYPTHVRTDLFTFDRDSNMLVGEMSTVLPKGFGRVFNDSCDEGFTLVSQVTGHRVVMMVNHIEKDDGDLVYWDLIPAELNKAGLMKVRIFND
jgi:hypothetical protein